MAEKKAGPPASRKDDNWYGLLDGRGSFAGYEKRIPSLRCGMEMRVGIVLPTHRKKRDGWGTRALVAGGGKAKDNAVVIISQKDKFQGRSVVPRSARQRGFVWG